MLVQPAPGDVVDPIECSDTGLREEASEEVSNNTANGVLGEDLDPCEHCEQQESLDIKKCVRRGHHHNQRRTLVEWRNCRRYHQVRRRQRRRLRVELLECLLLRIYWWDLGAPMKPEVGVIETRAEIETGAKTNSRPLLFNLAIPKHPSQATYKGSEVGDGASVKVGRRRWV